MNLNIAEDIINKALQNGADAAEVFMRIEKGASVEVKEGEVEALEASQETDIAVRVIKNGRLGFAFTTDILQAAKVTEEAMEGLKWTGEDHFNEIPEGQPPSEVPVFDDAVDAITEDELIKGAISLEADALAFDKRVEKVRKAGVSAGTALTSIVSSKGVNIAYESSYISAQISAFAGDGSGDNQIGSDYDVRRRLSDIDFRSVAVNAAENAIELLGSRKITACRLPILLPPSISVEFLEVLSASFSADAVQKQSSFLIGKRGKAVVSSLINIIDDGTMPWGSGSSPIDHEGVPSQKKSLISGGVLKRFLHNTYTAKKDGVISTGNAVRGSARSIPGVGVTNLYIKPSDDGNDKGFLTRKIGKGALITGVMGVHMANPVSGDFSIGISGLMVEGGNITFPFKEAVISGNILDLFMKVEEVGSDLKFYGSIGSPSLLIGEMDVSA